MMIYGYEWKIRLETNKLFSLQKVKNQYNCKIEIVFRKSQKKPLRWVFRYTRMYRESTHQNPSRCPKCESKYYTQLMTTLFLTLTNKLRFLHHLPFTMSTHLNRSIRLWLKKWVMWNLLDRQEMRPANALNYRVMSDVGSNCEEHNYKGE